MELMDGRCLCAAGCESKRAVLGDLWFLGVCFCCVQLPCIVGVCEYGPGVLFVHQGNDFLGLPENHAEKCLDDIQAGFHLCLMLSVCNLKENPLSIFTSSVVAEFG